MRRASLMVACSLMVGGAAIGACAHDSVPTGQAEMARQQDTHPLAGPGTDGEEARTRHAASVSRSGTWTRQELGPDYTPAGSGAVPTRRDARAWKTQQQQASADAQGAVR